MYVYVQSDQDQVMLPIWSSYLLGLHVEPIRTAPVTGVSLSAFLEKDRKCTVERRVWSDSSSTPVARADLHVEVLHKETDDSCVRTWVQYDVGLFTQGPVKVIVPHIKFSTCAREASTPAAAGVWLLNPHNLPPAVSDWGYWLPASLSTLARSGYNNSMAWCWY